MVAFTSSTWSLLYFAGSSTSKEDECSKSTQSSRECRGNVSSSFSIPFTYVSCMCVLEDDSIVLAGECDTSDAPWGIIHYSKQGVTLWKGTVSSWPRKMILISVKGHQCLTVSLPNENRINFYSRDSLYEKLLSLKVSKGNLCCMCSLDADKLLIISKDLKNDNIFLHVLECDSNPMMREIEEVPSVHLKDMLINDISMIETGYEDYLVVLGDRALTLYDWKTGKKMWTIQDLSQIPGDVCPVSFCTDFNGNILIIDSYNNCISSVCFLTGETDKLLLKENNFGKLMAIENNAEQELFYIIHELERELHLSVMDIYYNNSLSSL